MKFSSILIGFLLLISFNSFAQDYEAPSSPLSTKENYVTSEKDVIAADKWLEATPIGQQMDKRKQVNAWVMMWITGSPTVTINMREPIIKPFEKNPDLMLVFLAGYARYSLENNYSKDEIQSTVAGLRSVIKCYNSGGDVKKDKALSKVIDADKNGNLEDWVKEAMAKK
jgi:hypothetical protein